MENIDLISAIDLLLCVIIAYLGYLTYKKKMDKRMLYIGLAFGFFGVSHLIALLGIKTHLELFVIVIRTLAYLIVISALAKKHV